VWEDRSRGACWLPQEVFTRHGVDLAQVSSEPHDPRFGEGFRELVGVAHAHLRNALDYTLLIPGKETGIRRFCLWAIGLAVLTLRKIERNPRFTSGSQVKVKRSTVAMVRLLTDVAGRSDWMLRRLFAQAARGLPLATLSDLQRPRPMPAGLQEEAAGAPERARRRSYGNSGS
jgi:farnesyl-diphosphate farnesyltransferase